MINAVEGMDCTGSPDSNNSAPGFRLRGLPAPRSEYPATSIKRFCFCCKICKIDRGTDYYGIGFEHFFNAFIYHIILLMTFPVFLLPAFHTGYTASYDFSSKLEKLGFYTFILQSFKYFINKYLSVSTLPRTAVNAKYFHVNNFMIR